MPQVHQYDHYKVLGIARGAAALEVKQAYRERAKHYHPDVNPSPRAAAVFHAIHEAYRVLSDQQLRATYDAELRFYREVSGNAERLPHDQNRQRREHRQRPEAPPDRIQLWAFRGLHITGLLFGIALTTTILFGLVFRDWPAFTLAFTSIGVAIIPESLDGLRRTPKR
jgi:curved DNA-binding protein CbpA